MLRGGTKRAYGKDAHQPASQHADEPSHTAPLFTPDGDAALIVTRPPRRTQRRFSHKDHEGHNGMFFVNPCALALERSRWFFLREIFVL
jgi:hypothetical protein